MNDPWQSWMPPHPHWDAILRLMPSHVFIFDSALICRYAAPAGEAFLGRSAEQMTGRHAAEILPPASNGLRTMLERAAQEGSRWSTPHYRYSHRVRDAEIAYIWAIEVEPLAIEAQQAILVTLRDVLELVEERDQLRLEKADLVGQLQLSQKLNAERERESIAFGAHLRTLLTSTWGYLQMLSRHPEGLEGRSVPAMIEDLIFPQLRAVVAAVNTREHRPGDEP